ncbi:MAG TPA: hypothetical protein VL133_12460, partial [Devosia sp.]|nr:hypothetical protein [Devosia sp.]
MSLYTTKVTRRSILAGGAALVALAATPRLTMAAGSTPLPDLPYEVDIVNTGSNATLVLQALLDQLGYFKEFNVRANTLNVGDGTKLMGSLISNQSDICLLSGFSQVLPAIERGAKLKLVAGA